MALWNFAVDLRSLALFRIGLGVTLVLDLFDRARCFELLTDDGPTPMAVLRQMGTAPLTFHHLGGDHTLVALLLLAAALAVALTLGWRTRLVSVLSLVMLVSLQQRVNLTAFSGDVLLAVSLLWCCLLPTGARLSWDSRWDRRGGTFSSPAVLAVLLQPALLYVCSVGWKMTSASWRSGHALEEALSVYLVTSNFGHAVAAVAPVSVLRLFTMLTLVVEVVAPILLLLRHDRSRVLGFMALALMQAGMVAMLSVGWFALIGIVSTLPHLPSSLWASNAPDGEVPRERTALRLFASMALAFVLASNLLGPFVPLPGLRLTRALGLYQEWSMFRDPPRSPHGYFYVVAERADGVLVDVITREERPGGAIPNAVFSDLLYFRERLSLAALFYPDAAPVMEPYGAFLCRRETRRALERGSPPPVRVHGTFAQTSPAPTEWVELFHVRCAAP